MSWRTIVSRPILSLVRLAHSLRTKRPLRALRRTCRKPIRLCKRTLRRSASSIRTDARRQTRLFKRKWRTAAHHLVLGRALRQPHPHLLWSNDCPSELEASQIRQSITRAEDELRRILKKSPNARRLATTVKASQLWRFIQQHEATFSTVRRLPTELIQHILMIDLTSRVNEWLSRYGLPHGIAFSVAPLVPWKLGQICRRWRDAALSCPSLWSNVFCCPRLHTVDKPQIERFNAHMARLGKGPFRCVFVPLRMMNLEPSSSSHPILDSLIQRSNQWEEARLVLVSPYIQRFQEPLSHLDSLRQLSLQIHHNSGPSTPKIHFFSSAPNLKQVEISSGGCAELDVELPWSQLERLSLNSPPPSILSKLGDSLHRPFQLVSLCITGSERIVCPSAFLPVLQELCLRVGNAPQATHCLARITAPVLESLEVVFKDLPDEGNHEEFVASLVTIATTCTADSSPVPYRPSSLTRFKLDITNDLPYLSGSRSLPPLRRFFVHTPHLNALSVTRLSDTDVTALAATPDLLPRLSKITISIPSNPADNPSLAQSIREFCTSRSPVGRVPSSVSGGDFLTLFRLETRFSVRHEAGRVWRALSCFEPTQAWTHLQDIGRRLVEEVPLCGEWGYNFPVRMARTITPFIVSVGEVDVRLKNVETIVDELEALINPIDKGPDNAVGLETITPTITYHDILGSDITDILSWVGWQRGTIWERTRQFGYRDHNRRIKLLRVRIKLLLDTLWKFYKEDATKGRWVIEGAFVVYLVDRDPP